MKAEFRKDVNVTLEFEKVRPYPLIPLCPWPHIVIFVTLEGKQWACWDVREAFRGNTEALRPETEADCVKPMQLLNVDVSKVLRPRPHPCCITVLFNDQWLWIAFD